MVAPKAKQKTKQKTVQKTEQKTVHVGGIVHGVSSVARGAGEWLWNHKKPILASIAWLSLGTMLGAVRVIPPPANFVKLGLFRIAK